MVYGGDIYKCVNAHTAKAFDTLDWDAMANPVGTSIQFNYDWSSALAGDPGAGRFGINDADPALATTIFLSKLTSAGNDVSFLWSTVHVGDLIGFGEIAGDQESVFFYTTGPPIDQVTYYEIPGVYTGGSGAPEDNRAGLTSYIANPANKLPAGGTTGQHLAKLSAVDFDTEWVDPATGVVWTDISIDTPAVAGVGYNVDTALAAVLLTMPAVPLAGDVIKFVSAKGTFGTFPLTIGHNAIPIMGLLEDMTVNEAFGAATLEYINATDGWVITDGKK